MADKALVASGLQLTHKTRRGLTLAVSGLDLHVDEHEFVVIVGPSGCGKTTFLEAVAGLVPVAGGELTLRGKKIAGPGPERSLVFQQASLYPWRSVLSNVLFGLEMQGRLTGQSRKRAHDLLETAGLSHVVDKYPHELSGGMKQRVNLARALATDPALLLLDEPFSALDAQNREILQDELLRIWQADAAEKTALFVTHDVNEAVLLADRVLVFSPSPGRVALEITIDAPRPRGADWRRSAEFLAYGDRIIEALRHPKPEPRSHDDDGTAHDRDSTTKGKVHLGATAP
ncbi:ABC transporter ATP-binding protein [Actinocrispum sp. NPDC049592]|uniref:ABC transporter ATP-binding protein n=1 Tax=Actinocrispum sp. NPDC049592 TaxID=3154835 RepID=UPI00343F0EE4